MKTLVNDLLVFSKMEIKQLKLNVTKFDLNLLIQETIVDFAVAAKDKKIVLSYIQSKDLPDISADRERIKQVISILREML